MSRVEIEYNKIVDRLRRSDRNLVDNSTWNSRLNIC